MFNDLNQTGQGSAQKPVDDIFADTDKTAEAKKFSGYYPDVATPASTNTPDEIETQKAGLSTVEDLASSSKGKILKIGLIILLIILLFGLGYLVYAKFLVGKDANQAANLASTTANVVIPEKTDTTFGQDLNSNKQTTTTVPVSEEVVSVPSVPLATTTPPVSSLTDTDGDGLTDEEEAVLGTDINLKDTDADGLSDYEEVKIYNTDPKKIDSDNDNLPDYDEVKIYNTNPLKPDTDGDGYLDGAEVKSGYDPLVPGKKMTDSQKQKIVTPVLK